MFDRKWIVGKIRRFYCRIVREKATPEYIARGWAVGMFFGCSIPFGFQLVCSIPCAFLLKGSKIGATLGTLLTNHFTIFFIYPVQCWAGNWLLGGDLSYQAAKEAMASVLQNQDYGTLLKIGGELALSFLIGGLLLAAVMTPLTYWGVRELVVRHRQNRKSRDAEKN